MRKALLALLLAAAILAPAADAHRGYIHQHDWYSTVMEERILGYRIAHHAGFTFSALPTQFATRVLALANYREAKWTTRIDGAPFFVWRREIIRTSSYPAAAMIKSVGCSSAANPRPVWTPLQALRRWSQRSYYRAVLLHPGFTIMDATAYRIHKHSGYWEGRGVCTAYYVAFAGVG